MGLLDSLESQLGINHPNALQALNGLISSNGGISGLISRFTQGGLGAQVQSWIGNGQNLPVSADQIRQALSSDHIMQVAQKLGVDHAQATGILANILPGLIDKLTPHEKIPVDGSAQ